MSEANARLDAVQFAESAPARALHGLEKPELIEGTRRFLVAYYRDAGIAPHRLEGDSMREILLTHLPRRCGPKDPFVARMEEILRAFFDHLESTKLVAQSFEIRRALDEFGGRFEKHVRAVPEAERRFDEEPVAPIRRPAEKIGRNDPCPCGSGKKYKQCCQRLGS